MNKEQVKHTASEIVRAMTSYELTEEQQKALLYRAECVLVNELRKEEKE